MTLQQAGKKALDDIEVFKAAMPDLSVKNPFLKEDQKLNYVGEAYFGQKRQIGVPMVVNEVRDGEFKTLFIGSVE
jgi:branched-chain amino acid transport system substrate-binding protein